MYSNDELRELVTRRLLQLKLSPIQAAIEAGLERNFLRDWLTTGKKQSIKPQFYQKVALALRWPVERLYGPGGQPDIAVEVLPQIAEVPEIDLRGGLSYAGGFAQEEAEIGEGGAIVSRDAIRASWGMPVSFLRDELRIRPNRVHILAVRGDSMQDAIFDGDRVILDLDDTDASQGGIFAVLDDNGSVIIKQIELVRGGETMKIRCKSRNAQYEPFDLVLAEPVKIIGRVACKITRL